MRNCAPAALCVLFVGCHSLINPFVALKPDYSKVPVEHLREVAREIEQAVQNGDRNVKIADRGGIVVNDALIVQAIRTRAARSGLVNKLLDSGYAWERRDGHLYLLSSREYKDATTHYQGDIHAVLLQGLSDALMEEPTTRRQRDMNALVVNQEAMNRWTIYEGILKASNLPPRALSAIQATFHEARVDAMRQGQKYEDPSGNMASKGGEPVP